MCMTAQIVKNYKIKLYNCSKCKKISKFENESESLLLGLKCRHCPPESVANTHPTSSLFGNPRSVGIFGGPAPHTGLFGPLPSYILNSNPLRADPLNTGLFQSRPSNFLDLLQRNRTEECKSPSFGPSSSLINNNNNGIFAKKPATEPQKQQNTTPVPESEQCKICFDNKKDHIILPCAHFCLCGECAKKIKLKCPMCNGKIGSITQVYG